MVNQSLYLALTRVTGSRPEHSVLLLTKEMVDQYIK